MTDGDARRARLEPLPTLPVFFKLAGRRALVAGGDQPTVWKAELLAATGADVDVVASQPCPELRRLADGLDGSSLRLTIRDWADRDLEGAAIAVGSMPTDDEAARFRAAAQRAGVPVNVIDKPAFCDFQFGTLVARSPLVLAITTDGAAPVLGQALRTRLEALLPQGLRAWAVAAKVWRPRVEERAWPFRQRRRFWDAFARLALRPGATDPEEADFRACLDAAERDGERALTTITLVGCGMGDPDSVTFAAARALQDADMVVYDPDVAPETVGLARREAPKLVLGAEQDVGGAWPARAHGNVVWLGTGDPAACPHWQQRRARLGRHFDKVHIARGLQACPRCDGHCLGTPD